VAWNIISKFRKTQSVMAQSSVKSTGIVFSELRPQRKKLITRNWGTQKFQDPLEGKEVEVGTLNTFLGHTLASRHIPESFIFLTGPLSKIANGSQSKILPLLYIKNPV